MDLSPFIRDLILLNECVILRGVGGFETTYQHAVLDSNKKVIAPPSKHIHFQNEWIKDNGVLEEHIAKSLNISTDKASDYIDNYVQKFFNNLKKKGSVTLKNIGDFSLNEKQKLRFEDIENANYLADSFGLDVLNLEITNMPAAKPSGKSLAPVVQQKRKLTPRYIAIAILLLIISITMIIILSEGGNLRILSLGKHPDKSELIVFGSKSLIKEDSITQVVAKTLEGNTATRAALAIDNTDTGIHYYLVAGSFRTIRNAEILKEQLVRKGFEAETIATGVNIRVIVGKFSGRKRAIAELRRMRQQLDQSVWLLEEKE